MLLLSLLLSVVAYNNHVVVAAAADFDVFQYINNKNKCDCNQQQITMSEQTDYLVFVVCYYNHVYAVLVTITMLLLVPVTMLLLVAITIVCC